MSERPTYQPEPERKPFNIPPQADVFDLQRELDEIYPLPIASQEELKRKRDKAFGRGGEYT